MKKYSLFFALLIAGNILASAETMKFVSLLTQPIGTFASVEVTDTSKPATMAKLEFCNSGINGGSIAVSSVEITNDELTASLTTRGSTELRKTGGMVTTPTMIMKPASTSGTTFVGGALTADKADSAEIEVTGNLQLDKVTNTQTAAFGSMAIPGVAQYVDGSGSNCTASWSAIDSTGCKTAQHGTDAACTARLAYCYIEEVPKTGVWRQISYSPSPQIVACSNNCGCENTPCQVSIDSGDGTCAASEIGDECGYCTCDDGGLEQWQDACARNDYTYRCEEV